MNTNKVKLTESQLKQIVSESVKTVLSEMTPQFLAAAAQGADARGKTAQAERLRQGAVNRWEEYYGCEHNNGDAYDASYHMIGNKDGSDPYRTRQKFKDNLGRHPEYDYDYTSSPKSEKTMDKDGNITKYRSFNDGDDVALSMHNATWDGAISNGRLHGILPRKNS